MPGISDPIKLYRFMKESKLIPIDIIQEAFQRLNKVFWIKFNDGTQCCSFCQNPANYHNSEIIGFDNSIAPSLYSANPLYACESCMFDLKEQCFDVTESKCNTVNQLYACRSCWYNDNEPHSDDIEPFNPISIFLYELVHDWATHNYYIRTSARKYFEDYSMCYDLTHDTCSICHETVLNVPKTKVAISYYGSCIAHEQCAQVLGFDYDRDDIGCIILERDMSEFIYDIDNTPDYTPPISEADQKQLDLFVKDHILTYDFIRMQTSAHSLSIKNWEPVTLLGPCWCQFCSGDGNVYNKYIKTYSCSTCCKLIQKVDIKSPHSGQCHFVRNYLQNNLNKIFHIKTQANILFQNYNIQYQRCILCKKIAAFDDDLAVTNIHFAHAECLKFYQCQSQLCLYNPDEADLLKFHSRLTIDDVIDLPNFQLDKVLQLIRS